MTVTELNAFADGRRDPAAMPPMRRAGEAAAPGGGSARNGPPGCSAMFRNVLKMFHILFRPIEGSYAPQLRKPPRPQPRDRHRSEAAESMGSDSIDR